MGIMGQPVMVGHQVLSDFFENRFVPLNWNNAYFLPNQEYSVSLGEKLLIKNHGLKLRGDILYKLNNFGLRCEDFVENNNDIDHTLFAGCSFTFGESLPYLTNWSGILFNNMKSFVNISRYYSLGYGGGSIDYIIENIYEYVKFCGAPKSLFILFPDTMRKKSKWKNQTVVLLPDRNNPDHINMVWGNTNSIEYAVKKIKQLEIFALEKGIKLFWSSWVEDERNEFDKFDFNNFINFKDSNLKNKMIKKSTLNKDDQKYYEMARDESHPGIGYNSAIARIFMEAYLEKNN